MSSVGPRLFVALASCVILANPAKAQVLNPIDGSDDPLVLLPAALLAPSSGITIVPGSPAFVGRVSTTALAQSAVYTGFVLAPFGPGATLTLPDGILLTSGVGNVPATNTSTSFDNGDTFTAHPNTGGDAQLNALSAPPTTRTRSRSASRSVRGSPRFPRTSSSEARSTRISS